MRDANLMPLVVAGIFYLIMTTLLTVVFNKIEKRLSYYKV